MPAEYDPHVPTKDMIDAAWTGLWVRDEPTYFVRTPEFVAIIAALLAMLEDHYVPQHQAYAAVRRTARILTALVAEAERKPRPGERQPRW
jgi:hypothetical protein